MFERAKQKIAGAVALVGASLVPLVAYADEPGEAVFTAMGTSAGVYITAGFTLLAIVLGGTVGMKLVKKIISRST